MERHAPAKTRLLDAPAFGGHHRSAPRSGAAPSARRATLAGLRLRIEVLTFEGCPNAEGTRERVRQAVQLEAVDATIEFVAVNTPERAQQIRFLGSPSVRVDGKDVEPSPNPTGAYGLMCRMYRAGSEATGMPPIAMIRAAIRRTIAADFARKDTDNAQRGESAHGETRID